MAKRQEWIERGGLADFDKGWRKQTGRGAGVKIEQMSADRNAEVLLALEFEGSVRKVGEREACRRLIRFGEPAFVGRAAWFCHGE